MRNPYTIFVSACLLLALASPLAAEPIDYGQLWKGLSPAEKKVLLIGYARGLKSAETKMAEILRQESLSPAVGRRLSEGAASLIQGLGDSEQLTAVIKALDRFYDDPQNQHLDWTHLVDLARARQEGVPEEKIEAELEFLRQCAESLEEVRRRQEGK